MTCKALCILNRTQQSTPACLIFLTNDTFSRLHLFSECVNNSQVIVKVQRRQFFFLNHPARLLHLLIRHAGMNEVKWLSSLSHVAICEAKKNLYGRDYLLESPLNPAPPKCSIKNNNLKENITLLTFNIFRV